MEIVLDASDRTEVKLRPRQPQPLSMGLKHLLVSTKFAPPKVGSRYIVRAQLLEALQRGRHCKLSLVSGSAGFGKTILLAQWRQELLKAGMQVAWLSLSHDERLLANFGTHLVAALERLGVPIDEEAVLSGEGSASVDSMVVALVNGLTAVDDDLYLILDDYHHIEDPLAHRLVQQLLEHGPGNLHIAIASRSVPPLSIARLRVMGQVGEVECNDLPFSLPETKTFFERNAPSLKLTADEISEIHNVTYGWPASLQLLAITLRNRPESRRTLNQLASHSANLQNYLAEDVLVRLSPDLAQFMESVSICRRFNAALARTVSADPRTDEFLRAIEEDNLLIMRAESEDRSPWYRFHPLFAEFLTSRLERRSADGVAALHRRAGRWFAERGFVVEAIRHAMLGGDIDAVMSAIERSATVGWGVNHVGTMLHLANNLPPQSLASHPDILYLGGLTLAITGRRAKASEWIAQLDADRTMDAETRSFRVALAKALCALQTDQTDLAIDLLRPHDVGEAKTTFERHLFISILAPSLAAAGRFDLAYQWLNAHPASPGDERNDTSLFLEGCRNIALLMQGRFADALAGCTANHERAVTALGHRSMNTKMCAALRAVACYELGRVDEARDLLATTMHGLGATTPEVMIRAVVCQARLDVLQESPETGQALLERYSKLFRSAGLERALAYANAEQVRQLLARGDRMAALEIASRLESMAASHVDGTGFNAEIPAIAAIARSRAMHASGQYEEARLAASVAAAIASKLGRGQLEVLAKVLQARAMQVTGRERESVALLRAAVETGRTLGLARTFLDEGEPLVSALRALHSSGVLQPLDAAYLESLLASDTSQLRVRTAGTGTPEAPVGLSHRELQMVDLIAAGMSNKRIALTLGVTLETVKWNLKKVFAKLQVSSRYDATIRARRLGLIE